MSIIGLEIKFNYGILWPFPLHACVCPCKVSGLGMSTACWHGAWVKMLTAMTKEEHPDSYYGYDQKERSHSVV